VPVVIFEALVVSVVADVASPDTAADEMAIATLLADVILPYVSIVNLVVEVEEPVEVATTPEAGNLARGNVPELMLLALVVSVVADAANPDTAEDEIAMFTLAAFVILPCASTIYLGITEAPP
jgi:hypothetical protein